MIRLKNTSRVRSAMPINGRKLENCRLSCWNASEKEKHFLTFSCLSVWVMNHAVSWSEECHDMFCSGAPLVRRGDGWEVTCAAYPLVKDGADLDIEQANPDYRFDPSSTAVHPSHVHEWVDATSSATSVALKICFWLNNTYRDHRTSESQWEYFWFSEFD